MTGDEWARVDVSSWAVRAREQAGSTPILWLEEPSSGHQWLHKDTVIPSNGVEQGEDWSEVVSTQIAMLLGIPCAQTRLCLRNGRRGSLSRSVLEEGQDLWQGSLRLEQVRAPGYYPHTESQAGVDPTRPDVNRPGHSLENIRLALREVAVPPGFEGPSALTGFDVFAGYLVLDALIANPDRHEQNWAVLAPPLLSSSLKLAPSFDHASSLGYNVPDAKREARLQQLGGVEAWAAKGVARRFEHTAKPSTLVHHAAKAVASCTPAGADWWRDQLSTLDTDPVTTALQDGVIPAMSVPAVMFAIDVLDANLRRVRDAVCNLD